MRALFLIASLTLAILALRGPRWPYARLAYASYVVLALAYFPLRAGVPLEPRACILALDAALARVALQNYAHIILFAGFFLLSRRQFRGRHASLRAGLATLIMGALVEMAQGITGEGTCRLRDLLPDGVGALLGASLVAGARLLSERRRSATAT